MKKQRLWKTINPRFLSHQLGYIKNHLNYDEISWDCHEKNIAMFDTQAFRNKLKCFLNFAEDIDITKNIHTCCIELGKLMGTSPRSVSCPSICTPWGSEAPDGKQLWEDMKVWQTKVLSATNKTNRAIQWQLLLTLEGLMPWEQFNGFLVKLLWNVARFYFGLPLAMVPIKNQKAYYKELIIFSDKRITKQPLVAR